jgi:hypothetical protein
LAISPAQIDRLLRRARVQHPKKGLAATRPGTLLRHAVPTRSGPPDTTRPGSVEADTVAHCDDSTEGDYVNSLTFTELFSGWTENRAVWNKSGDAVLVQLKALEQIVPYTMKDFHTDNGGEFLNWALHRHLTGQAVKTPWTRSRAYRKNDNAHCEQKNWTHVRQLFGHDRFGHAELVPVMNALYAQEWSQFTNHFKPTFKLLKREKKNGKTKRIYERQPQTPYQRLLESPDITEAMKTRLRAQHALLDPWELKKSIEQKQMIVVGVNEFVEGSTPPLPLMVIDEKIEAEQIARLTRFRANRKGNFRNALAQLHAAAKADQNLLPAIVEAVRNDCTIGEIVGQLKETFGEHRDQAL